MECREWRSFQANNSGSAYLVGRFVSDDAASSAAADLTEFLDSLGEELDALPANERYARVAPTQLGARFADINGIEWSGRLVDGEGEDEEIEVLAVGDAFVAYHHYCLGFTRPGLGDYIEARGGTSLSSGETTTAQPTLCLLVKPPEVDGFLDELRSRFRTTGAKEIFFFDGVWAGIVGPLELARMRELLSWLEEVGATDHYARLEAHELAHRFPAVARASCKACGSDEMSYLTSFAYDCESDQLACSSCDAMFDVAGYFESRIAHLHYVWEDRAYGSPVCLDPLLQELVVIGRGRGADIRVVRGSIARRHCTVEYRDGEFFVCDLKSTNGTELNGQAIKGGVRIQLDDGDEIGLPDGNRIRIEILDRD